MNLIKKTFFLPFFMQMNIIYSSKKKNQGRELCPCMHAKLLQSCPTPCDPIPCQAPLSVRFSRQEYWRGCHFLLQGIFQTQGLSPPLLYLLYWHVGSLPLKDLGGP